MINLKNTFNSIIPTLKSQGITDEQIGELEQKMHSAMKNEKPPAIAFIGYTGVGKSSTINALFNAGQEISDVLPCTKEEKKLYGDVSRYTGSKGTIIAYDMPGLGEDIFKDEEYFEIYKRVLPIIDVAVWTFQADFRALGPMQNTLLRLKKEYDGNFADHLVFTINKADTIAPGETAWDTRVNLPSKEQKNNIKMFEDLVYNSVKKVLPEWNGNVVTYSAKRHYHLDELLTIIMKAVPKKRRWVYDKCADVADFTDLIDPRFREYIVSLLNENKE